MFCVGSTTSWGRGRSAPLRASTLGTGGRLPRPVVGLVAAKPLFGGGSRFYAEPMEPGEEADDEPPRRIRRSMRIALIVGLCFLGHLIYLMAGTSWPMRNPMLTLDVVGVAVCLALAGILPPLLAHLDRRRRLPDAVPAGDRVGPADIAEYGRRALWLAVLTFLVVVAVFAVFTGILAALGDGAEPPEALGVLCGLTILAGLSTTVGFLIASVGWRRRAAAVARTGWRPAEVTVVPDVNYGSRYRHLPDLNVEYPDGRCVQLRAVDSSHGSASLKDRPRRPALIGGTGKHMVVLFAHGPRGKVDYAVPACMRGVFRRPKR